MPEETKQDQAPEVGADSDPGDPLAQLRQHMNAGKGKEASPPAPLSAAAAYDRLVSEGDRSAPPPVEEAPPEPPVAQLYDAAVAAAPKGSPPSFKDWAGNLDEAELSSMEGNVQDFLRVVRADNKFPGQPTKPGPIVMYLQQARVQQRVIDVALEAFQVYKRDMDLRQ